MLKFLLTDLFVACIAALLVLPTWAEENPNQLLTALSSTMISGYVDTSAHWTPASAPIPLGYRKFPVVFVRGPHFVREGHDSVIGVPGSFRFVVHRIGGKTDETTVYLNFHSGDTLLAQGGVIIPAGASRATCTWSVPDNGFHDGARRFTATISHDPVRLQMPGAQYRTSSKWPRSATVVVLDPRRGH